MAPCSRQSAAPRSDLFIPFTVGGGIRTLDEAAAVFDAGADKVSVNSAALRRPELIDEIGARFGAQAVIVAIDARRTPDGAEVFIEGGRKPAGRKALEWAREAEQRGAGEILLTSMDADGTRDGFDCDLTASVSEAVEIPVIASGGAGNAQAFLRSVSPRKSRRRTCGQHLPLRHLRRSRAESRKSPATVSP